MVLVSLNDRHVTGDLYKVLTERSPESWLALDVLVRKRTRVDRSHRSDHVFWRTRCFSSVLFSDRLRSVCLKQRR